MSDSPDSNVIPRSYPIRLKDFGFTEEYLGFLQSQRLRQGPPAASFGVRAQTLLKASEDGE